MPPSTLPRTLRQTDLTLLLVGTVIGSGIFLVPGSVLAASGGHVGLALAVWLVGGVLSLVGALTYGELGAANPQAGGLYIYIRDAFGRAPAFLYGWTLFLVISSGALATLSVAFAAYAGAFVTLSPAAARAVSVVMIVVIAAINIVGTRRGANVQNVTTAVKVGALLVMSAALLVLGDGLGAARTQEWPAASAASLMTGVGAAMIGVLWAYEGWQYVTFSAGEAKDPQRNFPRAMFIGTAALIGIYLVANIAYVAALGPEAVATSTRVASDAVGAVLGPGAAMLIAAAILVSIFSAANGLTLTAPRVYFAMARDGLFFSRLAEVHPRFGTPAFAIAASALWAIVLATTGTFEQLLTYVVFTGWIFYALGAMSIFVYRRRQPDGPRPFSVPGYPVTPALFVLAAAALVLNTVFAQPDRALAGIAIVLLGVPAYLFWRGRA
ncbi:MAG TPA: amino acid permease [Vicinamibacterales bacterium]|nr:amino acid permease [Vicinamibacterales bacterium]